MIGFGSSIPAASAPAAVEAAYALFAIIADPAAHKERLDALVAAKAEAEARLNAIAGEQATLEELRERSVAARDESIRAASDVNTAQAALAVAKNDLDDREGRYAARQEADRAVAEQRSVALEERSSAVSDREAAVRERESVCYAREVDLGEKHQKADAALADAEAKQAEYSLKLAELKKITG